MFKSEVGLTVVPTAAPVTWCVFSQMVHTTGEPQALAAAHIFRCFRDVSLRSFATPSKNMLRGSAFACASDLCDSMIFQDET